MTRSLVVVAGSGRSGTSLFAGIMKRLGYTVPGPEVPADETNPRGFAESQWVVDFHTRLLRRAGVQTADARPSAWAQTARVGLEDAVVAELRAWLARQPADQRRGALVQPGRGARQHLTVDVVRVQHDHVDALGCRRGKAREQEKKNERAASEHPPRTLSRPGAER